MDVNKLGPGQRIAAGAAVLLLIDLWLDWYSVGAFGVTLGVNAWQAFGWTDLLMLVTIIVALAMAAQAMGMVSLPRRMAEILVPLAAAVTVIVLYRLINEPGPNEVVSVSFGAYLGLVLMAAITWGALRAQDEHETVAAPAAPVA